MADEPHIEILLPRIERLTQFEWRFVDITGGRWRVHATGTSALPLRVEPERTGETVTQS